MNDTRKTSKDIIDISGTSKPARHLAVKQHEYACFRPLITVQQHYYSTMAQRQSRIGWEAILEACETTPAGCSSLLARSCSQLQKTRASRP